MIRKKGFMPMLVLSLVLFFAAYATLIPFEEAEQVNLLGYRALSSFAPVSTLILAGCAIAVQIVRKRFFTN
ncbi:MAG: hypothetical protein JXR86_11920 [Spirochaetales bacterium]|nr:hypothetical protein [Spirochaetales bacterium]